MKNRVTRILIMFLASMLYMGAFSMTATAIEFDGSEDTTVAPLERSDSLTPDGNLTLVDDMESKEKEFIAVQTKDGNTFYIVIDHASDKDNVYFLNLVDEEDLLALIDDDDFVSEYQTKEDESTDDLLKTEPDSTVQSSPQASTESDINQNNEKSNSVPIAIALFCAIIIGVVVWVFKSRKSGKSKHKPNINIYDYGEDEEDTLEPMDEKEISEEETECEEE